MSFHNNKSINFLILIAAFFTFGKVYSQTSIKDYWIYADKSKTYESIDDILKINELQGKVVYVDIWGTRCGPCLMEFSYLPELKERFKNNDDVVFLYLCSPYSVKWNPENVELWKRLIVKHDLKGLNIFMSVESYVDGFYEKYKDKFSPNSLYSIPRYLLVDKTGNIVDFNAPRPSSKEKLYSDIQALLENKKTIQ